MKRVRETESEQNLSLSLSKKSSFATKEALAKVALTLRNDGCDWEYVMTIVNSADPDLKLRSVKRWIAEIRSGNGPFLVEKRSGRPHVLLEEKLRIVVGYVLWKNENGEILSLKDALSFVKDSLSVEVSKETLRKGLIDMGVVTKQAKLHGAEIFSLEEQIETYIDWIKKFRLDVKKGTLLCSLDFTYTSHRTSNPTTLAGRGKRNKAKMKISRFTNCVVTAVLSNGKQLPSIMYTYNADFRTDRKESKRRNDKRAHLEHMLSEFNISDDRICYDGKGVGEKGTFVREYNDMIRDFLEFHKREFEGKNVIFFSDNGAAFKDGEESIIEKLGYGKHIFYPSCVHQFISPNDNKLHGVAKQKWRKMFKNFDDDVACSLAFLKCLDDVSEQTICKWWKTNFFLDTGKVQEEDVKNQILNGQTKWSSLHDACVIEYQSWANILPEESLEDKRMSSSLDGKVWTK